MKLVSWNVNGLRAIMKKDFVESVKRLDPDILAIQETKLQEHQRTEDMIHIDGYRSYWSYSSVKKGYSGVAVYTRLEPEKVDYGIGIDRFDHEGRIIETTYKDFILFNVYFPNGQKDDERLQYKLDFYRDFFEHADRYRKQGKHLIVTGDFNIAHHEIDLKHPKANENRSGFLRIERDWLDKIMDNGYVDTFRHLHPETVKYSWWSYRANARKTNAGWRIDYFFATRNTIADDRLQAAFIDNDIHGSDHCPVGIFLKSSQERM
ncbi:MAG: exodeoxyribonuclease III [Proteobacteria bacterium]|nr:exodeoxyribonuclease III [Pseudomonadota bacterium]